MTTLAATPVSAVLISRLLRGILPLLIVVIVVFFAVAAPGFLTLGNLSSLLLNNFVLLAIVAIGMTWAVAAGGREPAPGGDTGAVWQPASRASGRIRAERQPGCRGMDMVRVLWWFPGGWFPAPQAAPDRYWGLAESYQL